MLSTLVTFAFFDAVNKEQIFRCNGNFRFWFCEYTKMPVFKSELNWRSKLDYEPSLDVQCYIIRIDCVELLRAVQQLKVSSRIYEYIFGVVSLQIKSQLDIDAVPDGVESQLINIYGKPPAELVMSKESMH